MAEAGDPRWVTYYIAWRFVGGPSLVLIIVCSISMLGWALIPGPPAT